MKFQGTIIEEVIPVINLLADEKLKDALIQSFTESVNSMEKIELCFRSLPERRWADETLATFFHSWKASHLKMLAIYGLSCRLQRLALSSEGNKREQLFISAARNAATSYEDLGLDYDGETHADLYDRFASAFLKDSSWQLESYSVPEALEFKRWIYRNMVVKDITTGLLTNIFSEIYNHSEYSLALKAFSQLVDDHYNFSPEEKSRALLYISVHVEDETEVDHFLVVSEALKYYSDAIQYEIDYDQAKSLFKEYLSRLGSLMQSLARIMQEQDGAQVRSIEHRA